MPTPVPAIDGWLTIDDPPALIGRHCARCGTWAFPPTVVWCPNPACAGEEMEPAPLSRTGRVWSYTDARYQPPPPYVATTEPYVPFAIAAVELERERLVVLGQVAAGFGIADLQVGEPVELVVEALDPVGAEGLDESDVRMVWRWRPVTVAS